MAEAAFRDNVIILTGASRGIGREMALQLAEQGARIALGAEAGDLEGLAEECRRRGGEAIAVLCDITDETQCARLVEQTVDTWGRVDTLINNAGITMWGAFEDIADLKILDLVMRVNWLGSAFCTWYALPHLKKSRGRIVAVASVAGKTGLPTRSGYAASKHAVIGFFDTLRMELAGSGVSVTVVCPDFVDTPIREHALGAEARVVDPGKKRDAKAMAPDTCARLILAAAAKRKRELIMSFRGKLAVWFRLLAPSLVDTFARKAVERDG